MKRFLFLIILSVGLFTTTVGFIFAQEDSLKPIEDTELVDLQENLDEKNIPEDKIENDLFQSADNIVIDREVIDNSYLAGFKISILKNIGGNLFAIANSIETGGGIGQSFFGIAPSVDINEVVKGDLFLISKVVNISAEIRGNVYILAEDVFINAPIGDDVNIVASRVIFNKNSKEDLKIKADEVFINSDRINGDLEISAYKLYITDKIKIDGNFIVNGKLVKNIKDFKDYNLIDYRSTGIPTSFENLQSTNQLDYLGIEKIKNLGYASYGVFSILLILGDIFTAFIIFKLFPVKSAKVVENLGINFSDFKNNIFNGLFFLISTIILLLLFGLSLIGLPVFFLLFFLFLIILQISKYFAFYKIGNLIVQKVQPRASRILINTFIGELIIIVIVLLFAYIPFIGDVLVVIFALFFTLWSIGAVVRVKFDTIKKVYLKK